MDNTVIKGTRNSRSILGSSSIPEDWSDARAQLIAAGWPIDMGPLNPAGCQKVGPDLDAETLLKDSTAAIAGLDSTSVPDDVLQVLLAQAIYDVKLAKITVLDEDENPVDGVKLSGVTAPDGSDAVTDDSGAVLAAVTSSVDVSFSSSYIDLQDVNQEIGPSSDKLVNNIAVTLPYVDIGNFREITVSGSYKTRKQHNALVCCVGSGQDGSAGTNGSRSGRGAGGIGGEGGKIVNQNFTFLPQNTYDVLIGANGDETSIANLSSSSGTKTTVPLLDESIRLKYGGDGAKGGKGGVYSSSAASPGNGENSNTAGGGGGAGGGRDVNTYKVVPGGTSAFGEPGESPPTTAGMGGRGGNGGFGGGGGGGGGGQGGDYLTDVKQGGEGGKGGPGILLVKVLD